MLGKRISFIAGKSKRKFLDICNKHKDTLYQATRNILILYLYIMIANEWLELVFFSQIVWLSVLCAGLIALCGLVFSKEEYGWIHALNYYGFLGLLVWFVVESQNVSQLNVINSIVQKYYGHLSVFLAVFGITQLILAYKKQKYNAKVQEWIGKSPATAVWIILLGALVIGGFAIRLNDVGEHGLYEDEFQVVAAAVGYYNTGVFYRWNFIKDAPDCYEDNIDCKYVRAWPHSWLIAKSYKIFGISEWSSRLVSVLYGTALIAVVFWFALFFTQNKWIALIASAALALYPPFIGLSRYARMYALLTPLFLILAYCLFRGLTERIKFTIGPQWLRSFMSENVGYQWLFIFASIILALLNFNIHLNSLSIFPAFFLFAMYLAIVYKDRKYKIAVIVGLLGMILFLVLFQLFGFLHAVVTFASYFARDNTIYLELLTRFPIQGAAGVLFLAAGILVPVFVKDKVLRDKLVFISLNVVFTLVFYIYVADRYPSFTYVSHMVPIAIITIIIGFLLFVQIFRSRIVRGVLVCLLLFTVVDSLLQNIDSYYEEESHFGDFSTAYQSIINNFDPSKDIIIGQYLRHYYLDPLDKNAKVISMLFNRDYKYEQFMEDIRSAPSGWVTWESRKEYHLESDIVQYCKKYFKKYNGDGVDKTKVEVYYFNQSMIAEDAEEDDEQINEGSEEREDIFVLFRTQGCKQWAYVPCASHDRKVSAN